MDFNFRICHSAKDPMKSIEYLKTKQNKKLFIQLENFKEIKELPAKNEQIRIITNKGLNTVTALLLIIQKEGQIENCIITSYRMNKTAIQIVKELLISKRILNLNILLQVNLLKMVSGLVDDLKGLKQYCNIVYTNNHTKIMTCKTKDNYYTFEGSGNMSSNAQIEQYLLENNKEVYDFYNKVILNIKDEGKYYNDKK
jgi:hypothetical protein